MPLLPASTLTPLSLFAYSFQTFSRKINTFVLLFSFYGPLAVAKVCTLRQNILKLCLLFPHHIFSESLLVFHASTSAATSTLYLITFDTPSSLSHSCNYIGFH